MKKGKRRFFEYVITPRWKIIQTRLEDMQLDKSKHDKVAVQKLLTKVNTQLKKIKHLSYLVFMLYALMYFSVISVFFSFSDVLSLFSNIVKGLLGFVGLPILFLILLLVQRNMENRYEDARLLITELMVLKKK